MIKRLLFSEIAVIVCFCLMFGCSNDNNSKVSPTQKSSSKAKLASYGCGSFITDSYTTLNSYYNYGAYKLDFTGVATGTKISIVCVPKDTPNRFILKDANNFSTVKYIPKDSIVNGYSPSVDGWIGTANYQGQWSRPNNPSNPDSPNLSKNSTQVYEFNKQAGVDVYNLWVETTTGPSTTDNWEVTILCSGVVYCCNCTHPG